MPWGWSKYQKCSASPSFCFLSVKEKFAFAFFFVKAVHKRGDSCAFYVVWLECVHYLHMCSWMQIKTVFSPGAPFLNPQQAVFMEPSFRLWCLQDLLILTVLIRIWKCLTCSSGKRCKVTAFIRLRRHQLHFLWQHSLLTCTTETPWNDLDLP